MVTLSFVFTCRGTTMACEMHIWVCVYVVCLVGGTSKFTLQMFESLYWCKSNPLRHSYRLYRCISCISSYLCQREHINACSSLPLCPSDWVFSVKLLNLTASTTHCNTFLMSAQPVLSVCKHKPAVVCDSFTNVLWLCVLCLWMSFVSFWVVGFFSIHFECYFWAKKVTMLVPKVFFIPSLQQGE